VKVKERSEGRCELVDDEGRCPNEGQEVHHILPRSKGGGNGVKNLLHLCRFDHVRVHSFPKISYKNGWLKK